MTESLKQRTLPFESNIEDAQKSGIPGKPGVPDFLLFSVQIQFIPLRKYGKINKQSDVRCCNDILLSKNCYNMKRVQIKNVPLLCEKEVIT